MTYVVGDAAFIGDTLFMPDFGTARADFPGGQRRIYINRFKKFCRFPMRRGSFCVTITKRQGVMNFAGRQPLQSKKREISMWGEAKQKKSLCLFTERDAQLGMPKLIIPSIQVNMRAGPNAPSRGRWWRLFESPNQPPLTI